MSKGWTWREQSLGAVTMDAWKTYSIPVSTNVDDVKALVPADIANIDFFALQAYSKAFRGAIYVDWIVFKSKTGTSDTIYTFNQKAPEEGNDNVVGVSLIPTGNVDADQEWKTATTSIYASTGVLRSPRRDVQGLEVAASNGSLRAWWISSQAGPAILTIRDLSGRQTSTRRLSASQGMNLIEAPWGLSGAGILTIQQGDQQLVKAFVAN
jgi:hypothetical protein